MKISLKLIVLFILFLFILKYAARATLSYWNSIISFLDMHYNNSLSKSMLDP